MDDAHLQELKQRAPGLAAIYHTGRDTILRAADLAALEQARVQVLGRKSALTEFLRSIPTLPAEERPLVGKGGNLIRKELEELVEEREAELKREALSASLAHERIDVTLPGQPFPAGHEHLISQTMREVEDIFIGLGYSIAEGPEVELDYYNFTALNTPPSHPARSAHDTFWVVEQRETMPEAVVDADRGVLLRTHTSPVQVRVMEQQQPPVYVVCLGKVYRRDSDATHTPMFHQVEGLVVDEGITLADLKGTVAHFTREFFGPDRSIRVRPHFFPFTEPSHRGRRRLPALRRQGLPLLQVLRLARDHGRRHGRPGGLQLRRLRPREGQRLRLRHGGGAHGDAAARHPRPAPVLRQRRPLPAAVLKEGGSR